MKKISYLIITFFALFFPFLEANAQTLAVLNGDDVRFRTSTNTSNTSNVIASYSHGEEFILLNQNADSNYACSKWYQVKKNNLIGYICGEFADIVEVPDQPEPDPSNYEEYTEYLTSLGFPDSYLPLLINLHNKYPNWTFKPYNVNLTFNYILNQEYNGYSEGWSLFEDTGRYYDGYKATDSWAYNYKTDVFRSNYEGGGINRWYAPNKEMLGYYLDPRNFLTERYIFMFETLSYNSAFHTREGVAKMLEGTFMTGMADDTHTFIDAFIDAANTHNVSPYVLVSRVIQEVGAGGSTIVSGTVPGYTGYYNFYNIRAYGNSASETIANGLNYAKSQDWNTKYKAIVGGASFLSDNYINAGQDTLYSQKWDIVGPYYISHQYMQNIEAPANEASKTYNGYSRINLLNSGFAFLIPIYKEMPSSTSLPNRGNPNNYLKYLKINDTVLIDEASSQVNYSLTLPFETKTVTISATPVNNGASVSNTGSINFTEDSKTITLTVTAANNSKREYSINLIRGVDPSLELNEIIGDMTINHDEKYLYNLVVNTAVTNIINDIKSINNNLIVSYFDKDNNPKNSGIVASGDTVKIKLGNIEKSFKIVISGDVSGDGIIAANDYVLIKNHIMDTKKLSDFELLCADVNHDGKILATDYVMIKNHIMGVKTITK